MGLNMQMTIKKKIYLLGGMTFAVFAVLALMNIWTYQQVMSNLRIRDDVNGKLAKVEEFAEWKNSFVRRISNIVASGRVSIYAKSQLNAPSELSIGESDALLHAGNTLVTLIEQKEQRSLEIERGFSKMGGDINAVYFTLDEAIATVLAESQMEQVMGMDTEEESSLAAYILKSLNQITVVALNALASRNFTTEQHGVVSKNTQFVTSQIQTIDKEGEIILLFQKLFSHIKTLDTLIRSSQQELSELDAQIAEAKKDFDNTVGTSEIDSIISAAKSEVEHANETLEKASRFNLITVAIFLIVVPVVVGVIIFSLNRAILQPVNRLLRIAHNVSEGDLNEDIVIQQHDEIGILAGALREMIAKFREIVADVKDAANNVAAGSQTMSASAEEMSGGASAQAAASEEASSSMEQMASNIRQTADNALQTEKIAVKAAADAQVSGQAVNEAVQAMRQIAQKVEIIEQIASRTHLLSMNASIEASKAKDYGKGFAVVATEVRNLAGQSETAAKEINELVDSTVTRAETAGEMLNKLVPDIQQTSELVQEISSASNEQSSGAMQVNQAIQALDHVTQQNALTSTALSTTAEDLANQAEHLQNAIAFFKIPERVKPNQEEWTDLQEILESIPDDDARNELLAAVKNVIVKSIPQRDKNEQEDPSAKAEEISSPSAVDINAEEEKKDVIDDEFERY